MTHLAFAFCVLSLTAIFNTDTFAQRQVAITIDDPHTRETPLMSSEDRNESILNTLDKHGVKAGLFVCGMRVDSAEGKALLEKWDKRNHLICNHSYSHFYYNGKTIDGARYIVDFVKGDSLIYGYVNYTKLFRYPYLKEGNTVLKRDSMRTALSNAGYRNGHVSIDASDWFVDSEMIKALKENANADLTPYKEYYIEHILQRAAYYDSLSRLLFNRDVKHTLLLHHNLINALFMDDLLTAFKSKGWELIDAGDAFDDPVYLEEPEIIPCGESIIWQCAYMNETLSKDLRYPAEDGEYEKEALGRMVKEYSERD